MKQTERIYRHLQDFGSITTLDAFRDYGITRLASRIWDLKQEGHHITKDFETGKNRYGESVSYARYKLKGGD